MVITETDTFRDGDTGWSSAITVASNGGTHTIQVFRAGDCYIDDNDYSTGGDDPATGAVSCQDPAHQISYLPASPDGVHHIEAFYADVWQAVGSPDALPDTVRHDVHDSGLALQWRFTVDPAHPVTLSSRSVLGISPAGPAAQAATVAARQSTQAAERPDARQPR